MNKDDKKKYSDLIDSFFRMEYSSKVRTRFYAWLLGQKNREEKERAMQEKFVSYDIRPDRDVQKSLSEVHKKIGITGSYPQAKRATLVSTGRRFLRITAIVVPVMILIGSGFYFLQSDGGQQPEYMSVVVKANEKQQLTLPDNSKVWVNSSSEVKYPKDNEQDQRLVELSGEAYFVVEKDINKPFIVKTDHLSVTVFGTEFDVKEIEGADITQVTLTEGKVSVETNKKETFSLLPGQQLTYHHLTGRTEVTGLEVPEIENVVIWKSERLHFRDMALKDMLSGIEAYFNVTVDRSALSTTDKTLYTIRFSPNEDLNTTMKLLRELTNGFDYRIEEQVIYVTDYQINKHKI